MTTTAEQIAAFPRATQDRASEWVALNVDIDTGNDDDPTDWNEAYDAAILSACQELAAIDAANDRADRLAAQ